MTNKKESTAKAGEETKKPGNARKQPDKEVKTPAVDKPAVKVGETVHYYHNGLDKEAAINNAEFVPAIVTQVGKKGTVNLRVFQDAQSIPLSRRTVKVGEETETPYCVKT